MVTATPGFEAAGKALTGPWVGVAGRAHLDGGSAGKHKFDRVFRRDYTSHAKDRNVDGAGGFIDHAQGDGLDGWAGEAAGNVTEARAPRLRVNGHGKEGVDQADRVGTGALGDFGHVGDGGDVGGELDDERPGGSNLGTAGGSLEEGRPGGRNLGRGEGVFGGAGVCAESHAPGVDVGADPGSLESLVRRA